MGLTLFDIVNLSIFVLVKVPFSLSKISSKSSSVTGIMFSLTRGERRKKCRGGFSKKYKMFTLLQCNVSIITL